VASIHGVLLSEVNGSVAVNNRSRSVIRGEPLLLNFSYLYIQTDGAPTIRVISVYPGFPARLCRFPGRNPGSRENDHRALKGAGSAIPTAATYNESPKAQTSLTL
jgi:hypothetical protein